MELQIFSAAPRPRRTIGLCGFGAEREELAGQPDYIRKFMRASLERIVLI